MTWWESFWQWTNASALGSEIVGGVSVAAILGLAALILSKLRRPSHLPAQKGIVSFAKRLWGHRPVVTTRRRYELALRKAEQAGRVETDHRIGADGTVPHGALGEFDVGPPGAIAQATIAIARQHARGEHVASEFATARPQIQNEENSALSAPRSIPLPEPRWVLWSANQDQDHLDFVILNTVERSVAKEVRVESSTGQFVFLSGGHWEDLSSGGRGEFRGEMDDDGWNHGLNFEVTWYDNEGDRHERSVRMQPPAKESGW